MRCNNTVICNSCQSQLHSVGYHNIHEQVVHLSVARSPVVDLSGERLHISVHLLRTHTLSIRDHFPGCIHSPRTVRIENISTKSAKKGSGWRGLPQKRLLRETAQNAVDGVAVVLKYPRSPSSTTSTTSIVAQPHMEL